MAKVNELLRSARLKLGWTPELVSERLGISLGTYNRWESGKQIPRPSSLRALCNIFRMSPVELGYGQYMRGGQYIQKRPATSYPLQSMSQQDTLSAGRFSPPDYMSDADAVRPTTGSIAYEVINATSGWEEEYPDTADELNPQELSDALVTWSMGLTACWQWYMSGGQKELEQLVSTYIARLSKPALTPGSQQRTAASLISQVYQLAALLELQRADFVAAQNNGTQALIYAQLAKDWNLFVASQLRLAQVYSARKRIGSALNAYNDALRCVNSDTNNVSPLLHSWIFGGLAEIQAAMGREAEALQFLQLAHAVFPAQVAIDDYLSYIHCDRAMLYLYQGLVLLRLGQPRKAWNAFALVDELKPVPPERVRADFLRYRAYTSIMLGNMIQSCIYLEAAARAAQTIGSDLISGEIYGLYEHMLVFWGQEPRVRALAALFQK